MNLHQILEEFGLSERQAKVYLANLELGEATIAQIALKAQIERTGVYYLVEGLSRKGLITHHEKGKREYCLAATPSELLEIAKHRERLIHDNLSQFTAFANLSSSKPHVRLYEGISGIQAVFAQTIRKPKSQMLAFSPYQTAEKTAWYNGREYVEWGLDYLKERAKKQIFARVIAEDTPASRSRKSRDEEEWRETRLVPTDKFIFTNEICILDDWVAVVSYKEMIALMIESKEFARTLRAIFELAWVGAEKFEA